MASLKQQAKKLRVKEKRVQVLAFAKTPEARKTRMALLESRLWQDRQQADLSKGQGDKTPKQLTARGKAKAKTAVSYMTVMKA